MHGPDGLCDHELVVTGQVVHQCGEGLDLDAQRVFTRMRDSWLSEWLLLYSKPVPPREDVLCCTLQAPAMMLPGRSPVKVNPTS